MSVWRTETPLHNVSGFFVVRHLVLGNWVKHIPMASLVAVMIMVSIVHLAGYRLRIYRVCRAANGGDAHKLYSLYQVGLNAHSIIEVAIKASVLLYAQRSLLPRM
jgi:hypothetical protein